jgi:hypothetical protein
LLVVSPPPIHAQESPASEKIQDVSSDRKFAVRISFSSMPADPGNIDLNLITAGSRTRFSAIKNQQASNNVKEKHPSNE